MSEELLKAATRKYGQAEVYRVEGESVPVTFEANKLKELSAREASGVALRVINKGRIGFTSTTNADDEAGLVARAGAVSEFGAEAKFSFPKQATVQDLDVFDPRVEKVTRARMIDTGRDLIERLREKWPEMLCEGRVGRSTGRMNIWNSSGVEYSYQETGYYIYLGGKLIRGTDMLNLWQGHSSAGWFGKKETDGILDRLLQQLEYCRNIAPAPVGDVPVIFTPRGLAAALLDPLLAGFNGKNIADGASPLIGKEGTKVLDDRISISDDPTVPMASGSRPCDDEGVPSRKVVLMEKGVAGGGYFDLQSAGRAGRKTTGSAHRSLTAPPGPGTSLIDIAPGGTPYGDLFAGIKSGLVVEELLGAGQGNVLGGEFRASVSLGYRIENGVITGRVKDTMISGNVYKALAQVEAVSDKAEWVFGSMRAPAIRCRGVEVAAKGG